MLQNMASRILLDANVLIDYLLKREHFETSKRLLQGLLDHHYRIFITPAILHITAYWLRKALGASTAKEISIELLRNIKVVDCDHKTAVLALNSTLNDVEDALQYYTALQHNMDFVITQDQKFQKQAIPSLPIYSPESFLKTFID